MQLLYDISRSGDSLRKLIVIFLCSKLFVKLFYKFLQSILSFYLGLFQNEACIKQAVSLLDFAEEIVSVPKTFVGRIVEIMAF